MRLCGIILGNLGAIRAFGVIGVLAVSVLSGCGSDDGGKGKATEEHSAGGSAGSGGSSAGSAGTAGIGGGVAAGVGGSAGVGGASVTITGGGAGIGGVGGQPQKPKEILSNLSNVVFERTDPAASHLELVTSNLVQEEDVLYVEWFAEVKNNGTAPACYVKFEVSFQSVNGVEVQKLSGFVDGDAYKIGSSDLSSSCLAPGATGVIWTNDIPDFRPRLEDIKIAKVKLVDSGLGATALPHPAKPIVITVGATPHPDFISGYWALTGQAKVPETIYNVRAQGYFRASTGFLVDQIAAYNLETLFAGSTWNFASITGYKGAKPVETLVSMSFITGAKSAGAGAGEGSGGNAKGSSDLEQKVAEAHASREALLTARQTRRESLKRVNLDVSNVKEFGSKAQRLLPH